MMTPQFVKPCVKTNKNDGILEQVGHALMERGSACLAQVRPSNGLADSLRARSSPPRFEAHVTAPVQQDP